MVFAVGGIGSVVAYIFGYGKTLDFDVWDDGSIAPMGFWSQWQFWVCFLMGAIHISLSFHINEILNHWFAQAYFFSIFALGWVKSRINNHG